MHSCTVHGPTNFIFYQFFIKNGSHGTIYTFKNYFTTVFSVFSFNKISSIQINPLFRILRFKREREREVIFLFFCCFSFSLWTQSVILGYKLSIESNQPNGLKIFFTFWQIYYVPKPSIFFFPSLNLIKSFFLIVLKRKYIDEKLKIFNNLCMKIEFIYLFIFLNFKEKKVKHFQ